MKDQGLLYRLSLHVVPAAFYYLMRLWLGSCRYVTHQQQHLDAALATGHPCIATFWHYGVVATLYRMRHYSGVAMVSSSRDGEYTARLAARFGFASVRGSRNRKGVAALKDLVKALASGQHCIIVADGSQGPAMVAQPGSILLAAHSGAVILPIACSASRYWAIRSWDRTLLPQPFCQLDFFFGEPLAVPDGVRGEQIEVYRLQLEERLQTLYQQAWAVQQRDRH